MAWQLKISGRLLRQHFPMDAGADTRNFYFFLPFAFSIAPGHLVLCMISYRIIIIGKQHRNQNEVEVDESTWKLLYKQISKKKTPHYIFPAPFFLPRGEGRVPVNAFRQQNQEHRSDNKTIIIIIIIRAWPPTTKNPNRGYSKGIASKFSVALFPSGQDQRPRP